MKARSKVVILQSETAEIQTLFFNHTFLVCTASIDMVGSTIRKKLSSHLCQQRYVFLQTEHDHR